MMYSLTWAHNDADQETLCEYVLTTIEVNCYSLSNSPYYAHKSHASELVIFDDYLVLSAVSTDTFFGDADD